MNWFTTSGGSRNPDEHGRLLDGRPIFGKKKLAEPARAIAGVRRVLTLLLYPMQIGC